MAADKDYTDSMPNYGYMLYKGDEIEANKKEAARYIKMAADNGDEVAIKIFNSKKKNGEF